MILSQKVHQLHKNRILSNIPILGGTCTGEHGVGVGKIELLKTQFGPDGINLMKTIKSAIDPVNIMNPGKIIK